MEDSILNSTKKILGIEADYPAFDVDVITHINSTFAIVHQLGVGPEEGFAIEDESEEWGDLGLPLEQLNLLRTYLFLRVRMLFDPPATSFLIDAMNKQIEEYETRLSISRETTPQV
jgi:hypothetical protein